MKFANHIGYSDINPYEVVKVVSDKTLLIRAMNAEKDPAWAPEIIPGGFCGHCVNQSEQSWIITSDPNGVEFRIRLNKNGYWKSAIGEKFQLSDEPVKFYDYNF